ncbi:family 43 glycosylhydrolase [Halalkalibacter urbisdiaboli]|uniref:family 43 glycosylhydrolase n=1 Tax=Halalkalibacter urbisdiaboli TaxID=1960589 RepID=UPI000B436488|nr:family 43 glycosylhydrolase [Halalkalibacter urbisdiaboli]
MFVSKGLFQKLISVLLILALLLPTSVFGQGNGTQPSENSNKPHLEYQGEVPEFLNASVHDPSVIKVDDTYYVFGSHLAAAKTKDFMKWEKIADGATPTNPIFEDVTEELKETFDWAQSDTLWAADVIQLEDGKYYMYYNACKGDSPRSAMGIAVADHVEGPYKDLGIFLKSGMWDEPSEDGTIYDATIHPNAVDPDVFFDKDGKLWMMYGSYSGGIFILEMDPETGKPLPDQGYGKKLLGGNHSRIEGAYVLYSPETDYYYMYLSFGGLDADGGYNMRVVRSENPDGPYYDAEGNDMINVYGEEGTIFDDRSIEKYGVKLMGNFLFEREVGDPGTGIGFGYVSPGHNSAYYDTETGQQYLIFHSRFPEQGEMHEVRVHQMYMNKDGWPVVSPYRYSGETIDKVNRQDVIGDYKFVNHGKEITADIKKSVFMSLNKNNTISGDVNGTWNKTAHNEVELTVDGETYKGVFVRGWDPTSERYVMTFTAVSEKGVSVWGSKIETKTDAEIVADVKENLTIGNTDSVIADLPLPTEGTRHTEITWTTSDANVISETGVINRPEAGSESTNAVLTAKITKGDVTDTKEFYITVLPHKAAGLAAHYQFEGGLADTTGNFDEGTVTGNRIDNSDGTITYTDGKDGQAAVFNGASGVRLPNGLISSNTYSVSVWLNPEEITPFTTTFFGARDGNNWVSLLPAGWSDGKTMVWSGSSRWYDAVLDGQIGTNKWTHLAFTVDNGEIIVYVDGVQQFSGTDFPNIFTTSDASFSLGVNWWDVPFKGLMDDLRVYEGALSPTEVTELAK